MADCRFLLASLLLIIISSTLAARGEDKSSNVLNADKHTGRPRLIVLLVFDQMRADYLTRWNSLFGAGGLRRLIEEGADFANCHYDYAGTRTAAGHATLVAGCPPAVHGMIDNEWIDRDTGEPVGCVLAGPFERVPMLEVPQGGLAAALRTGKGNVSPLHMKAPGFADALKEATGGKARVVSLSLKDRSAAIPGGRRPDVCYWFDLGSGLFVTSSFYRPRQHDWVAEFNRGSPAGRWFRKDWTRLRTDVDYSRNSGPDAFPGEGQGYAQGMTFPHPLDGGQTSLGKRYYEALFNSPFGNELLLDLALRAVDAEGLGRDEVTDFLSISFSSNDIVGHCWGPDSQEVMDITLRSDLLVKKLLERLDASVGQGRYLVVLSSDHGVCPLPENFRLAGKEGGRIDPDLLALDAEDYLDLKFRVRNRRTRWFMAKPDIWFYLHHRFVNFLGLRAADVETALADWLKKQPGIQAVYTRSQLLNGQAANDPMFRLARRSFFAERSGDLFVVPKEGYIFKEPVGTGTTHGTPHPYDTHVPLVVFGPRINPGRRADSVAPASVAAILAHAAGIRPPEKASAEVPKGLFRDP